MQRKQSVVVSLVLGFGLISGSFLQAEDKSMAAGGASSHDAMMQQMQKYMTPGLEHRQLDPMIGRWNAVVTSWMKPGDKPEMSTGTAENTWILNGHFVKQDFSGTWMGKPFQGTGYTGYDIFRAEYQSVWLDNMGTGMMYSAGATNPKSKAIEQTGTMGCPMTGEKSRWYRAETKFSGNDKFTYTSYAKGPDGKEFKGMEIVYTRAK